jgi:hypothetical protein
VLSFRRLVWFPFLLGADPAFAHAPIPGIKGFYTGLIHPFSTPAQALLILGLGLLIGGLAVEKIRWNWGTFSVSLLAGLIAGSNSLEVDAMMFASAFAACSVAALFPGRLMQVAIVLSAIGGFLTGSASIPEDGEMQDRIITISGSIVGASIGLLYIFGLILVIRERYTWPWVGTALRVVAAWLGAIALLMLALESVGNGTPA